MRFIKRESEQTVKDLRIFKFISDNSSDAHFLVGCDAKFRYVNKAACRMLGYSEEEILTLGVPDVASVYDIDKYQGLFDLIQRESVPPIETINRRKNGTPGIYAFLSVSDTGTGMDENTMERIFESFYTTTGVVEGTGLGLSIAYGIIKQHNGYIEAKSRLNEGSTFTLYLPIMREQGSSG